MCKKERDRRRKQGEFVRPTNLKSYRSLIGLMLLFFTLEEGIIKKIKITSDTELKWVIKLLGGGIIYDYQTLIQEFRFDNLLMQSG